jgi:hypothetical protein
MEAVKGDKEKTSNADSFTVAAVTVASRRPQDERKDGDSNGQNELLAAAQRLDQTHMWILSQQQQRYRQTAA